LSRDRSVSAETAEYCREFGDDEGSDGFFGIVCRRHVRESSKRGERVPCRYVCGVTRLDEVTLALPSFSLVMRIDFNDRSRSPCKHAIKRLVKNRRETVRDPVENVRETADTVQTVDTDPFKIP